MKASKYNKIVKYNQKYIYYNTLYNSLFATDTTTHNNLKVALNSPNLKNQSSDFLQKYNFLISDDCNEEIYCRHIHEEGKYHPETMSFTLILGYGCNFDCSYCFQRLTRINKINYHLNSNIFNNLLLFIKPRIKNFKNLDITWMGGEPLLYADLLFDYYKKINNITEKFGINYYNLLITNGYLINKDVIKKIKNIPGIRLQFTIDGPPNIHNTSRKNKVSNDNFHVVFNNIIECINNGIDSFIRINLNPNNYSFIDQLFHIFDNSIISQKKNIVHIAKIANNLKSCEIVDDNEYKNFSKVEFEILSKNITKKYLDIPIAKQTCGCRGLGNYEFIIDPDGKIYKCPRYNEEEKTAIGNLNDINNTLNDNYIKWQVWSPFQQKKCTKCNLLPICMGGCPYNSLYNNSQNKCSELKFYIDNRIKLSYLKYKCVQNESN